MRRLNQGALNFEPTTLSIELLHFRKRLVGMVFFSGNDVLRPVHICNYLNYCNYDCLANCEPLVLKNRIGLKILHPFFAIVIVIPIQSLQNNRISLRNRNRNGIHNRWCKLTLTSAVKSLFQVAGNLTFVILTVHSHTIISRIPWSQVIEFCELLFGLLQERALAL